MSTFKRCKEDDPAWWERDDFHAMTAKQRAAFRKREREKQRQVQDENAQPFPECPPVVWLTRLVKIIAVQMPVQEAMQLLGSLACTNRELRDIVTRETVWKRLHPRLLQTHPLCNLRGQPMAASESQPLPGSRDSWRALTLRLVPTECHGPTCARMTKTRALTELNLKEQELNGQVRCTLVRNPHYRNAPCMVLIHQCTLNRLSRCLPHRPAPANNRKERKKEIVASRRAQIRSVGLQVLMPVLHSQNEVNMLTKFLSNGKGWTDMKAAGQLWHRVVVELFPDLGTADAVVTELVKLHLSQPIFQLIHTTASWDQFADATHRAKALKQHLGERGLEMRADSSLCQKFIVRGRGSVTSIADTMEEMAFIFRHDELLEYTASVRECVNYERDNWREFGDWVPQPEWRKMVKRWQRDASHNVKDDIWKALGKGEIVLPQGAMIPACVQKTIADHTPAALRAAAQRTRAERDAKLAQLRMQDMGRCQNCAAAAKVEYTPCVESIKCGHDGCTHRTALTPMRLCKPKCPNLYWDIDHSTPFIASVGIYDGCFGCGRRIVASVDYTYLDTRTNAKTDKFD